MPKVSDAHREARREQIVQAALGCFVEKGFHRTSMADIIAASGLSAGAIYLQFESKQDIMLAAAETTISHRIGEIGARLATPPFPDPDEFVELVLGDIGDDAPKPQLLVQLWGESFFTDRLGDMVDGVFMRLRSTVTGYLTQWAVERRGLDADAAAAWGRETAPAMLSLLQGRILQSTILADFDADAYRAAIRNLFP